HLDEAGIPFIKTHDLITLFEQILPLYPQWEEYRADLAFLSDFAVSFRYPGESADRESALDARRRCRVFRGAARSALGLTDAA
ncbi:MAG: HEPN domain-containing protein, partial [Anaerolineae bacterium]